MQEVARIEREIGYLKTVVNEFLDYARRPPLELGEVALRPLLDDIRELVSDGAPGGPAIAIDTPAAGVTVRADAGQLRRALLNLARNAVAAARSAPNPAGERPRVFVLGRGRGGGYVRIEVSDSGPGVPMALRETIFTPFFTTREKGTGLGLAFVREIVRDHGSDVSVSDAPGGGASFQFDLPTGRATS